MGQHLAVRLRFIAGFIVFNAVIVAFAFFFYDKSRDLALDARMSMLNAGLDSTLNEVRNIYPSSLPKNNNSPRLNNLLRTRAANLGHGLEYLIITRIKGKCRALNQTKSSEVNAKNGELECMAGMLETFGTGQSRGNYQPGYRKGVVVHYVSKRFVTSSKQGGSPKSYIIWLAKNNVAFEATLKDFRIILNIAVAALFIFSLILCIGGYIYAVRSQRIAVKNQAMLDSMPSSNITAGEDQIILSDNPAVEVMFGWETGKLVGEHLHKIIPERYRPDHDKGYERYYATDESEIVGKAARTLLPALRKDGSEFPCSLLLSKMVIDGKVQISAMFVDITPQQEAKERIERQVASMKRIGYMFRHDVANHMTPVNTAINFMMKTGKYSDKAISLASRESKNALLLLKSLSEQSRLAEQDIQDLEIERVELGPLIESVKPEGIELIMSDMGEVTCNIGLLQGAYRNMFENAQKYASVDPMAKVYREGNTLVFEDNAGGFACVDGHYSKEEADRMMSPRERGRSDVPGSGLGLFNIKTSVETHGWNFDHVSECGKSTKWKIIIK